MAKKNKQKKRRPERAETAMEIDPATGEDRRAAAVTVAWMLTMLATTVADLLAVTMFVAMPLLFAQAAEEGGMSPLVFPRLLLLIAALTGAACVSLTPFVYRFRRVPPPPAITAFGLVASISPVVALFLTSISR